MWGLIDKYKEYLAVTLPEGLCGFSTQAEYCWQGCSDVLCRKGGFMWVIATDVSL